MPALFFGYLHGGYGLGPRRGLLGSIVKRSGRFVEIGQGGGKAGADARRLLHCIGEFAGDGGCPARPRRYRGPGAWHRAAAATTDGAMGTSDQLAGLADRAKPWLSGSPRRRGDGRRRLPSAAGAAGRIQWGPPGLAQEPRHRVGQPLPHRARKRSKSRPFRIARYLYVLLRPPARDAPGRFPWQHPRR